MTRRARRAAATKYERWTSGDRVGKLSAPLLREHRVRSLIGGTVDVDLFIEVVEALEGILDATDELPRDTRSGEGATVVEEVPDLIREIQAARVSAVEDQEGRVKEIETKYDDLETSHAAIEKEHAAEVAEHCAIIDNLRRNVDILEHALTEHGNAEAIASKERALEGIRERDATIAQLKGRAELAEFQRENLDNHVAELTRMINLMRAEKPLKKRGTKS